MKTKLLCLLLACLATLALTSCSDDAATAAVQEFVDNTNKSFENIEQAEVLFEAEARGTQVVYKYKVSTMDSTVDAEKEMIMSYVEQLRADFESSLAETLTSCSEVSAVIHEFYDKNDVFVCSVTSDDPNKKPDENADIKDFAAYLNVSATVDTDEVSSKFEARGDKIAYMITLKQVTELTAEQKAALIGDEVSLQKTVDDGYAELLSSVPTLKALIYEYYEADGDLIVSCESKK